MNRIAKIALRALANGLSLFKNHIVGLFKQQKWRDAFTVFINALQKGINRLFDADPNNDAQMNQIAVDIFSDPVFLSFQSAAFDGIVAKIDNQNIREALLGTEKLRSQLIQIFGDANPNNKEQVEAYLKEYLQSEDFMASVLNLLEAMAEFGKK